MKNLRAALLCLIFPCSQLSSTQVSDLTYENLLHNGYTDHVQHFRKFFQHRKPGSFLEFGLGYGTKYFLDHCAQVTSVEILLPNQSYDWVDQTLDLLQDYTNWTPIIKQGSRNLLIANDLSGKEAKDPALYGSLYRLELKEICDELFKDKQYEVAFVDPGFHMRGDLVNELFDRVPIIVAHDTGYAASQYGWNKIQTPSNYEKIVFREGAGVTFWIRSDQTDLIVALGGTIPKTPKKGLRIFFPRMHDTLLKSMAMALNHLGHTLVLPGDSFKLTSQAPGPKISYWSYLNEVPLTTFKNIQVIENDEIFSNPPDVLVVNCGEVEQSIYHLLNALKSRGITDTKLVHYSGNNASNYNPEMVKNLIAVDAHTAHYHDPAKTNIIFWIPWIDFETLSFDGFNDGPVINSYLGHYYLAGAFPSGARLFNQIVNAAHKDFPSLQIRSLHSLSQDALFPQITQSVATLHLKESEGFGYTILESLSKGRPVFLKRGYSLGSRLMNWCIEGKTAFFFDDYAEFKRKMRRYLDNADYRHQVQASCAQTARLLIDNEKQARILEKFLQNL